MANPNEAEDAVQEVFIELWKAAPKFDPRVASAKAFVSMIARRRIIDRGRIEMRRVRGVTALENVQNQPKIPPRAKPLLDDEAERLAQAIQQLKPEQQQTIRLAIGQGWSHQDIADRLGIPLGTVKTNLRRGLQRLRERIEGWDGASAPASAPRPSAEGATT